MMSQSRAVVKWHHASESENGYWHRLPDTCYSYGKTRVVDTQYSCGETRGWIHGIALVTCSWGPLNCSLVARAVMFPSHI